MLKAPYFEDLIRVFYSNLNIVYDGNLFIKVSYKMIVITPSDWILWLIRNIKGQKFSSSNIPNDLNYDRDMTLATMIRPDMHGQNVRNVGSLNMNDILLHYTFVHILSL